MTDELLDLMAADAEAEELAIPTDDKLKTVGALAKRLLELEAEVREREKGLEETRAKLARVAEIDLPDALAAAGLAEIKLPDGTKVSVGDDYYTNIPSADTDKPELAERRKAAFDWLRAHGHADLIKEEVKLAFSRGEGDKAQRVMNGLDKAGIPYSHLEGVHAATLKAFVREQLTKEKELTQEDVEAGRVLPRQVFGVHVKRVAKVKPVKGKARG